MRYNQSRSDPDAQAIHVALPMIAAVDDHEFADGAWRGGADVHDEEKDGSWSERLKTCFRVRWQSRPIRHPNHADTERVYRSVHFGGLADLLLINTRTYRDQPTTGGLIHMACLGNTGFIGFPLVAAYFGEQQISHAVICDQSTVLLFSTVGAVIAVKSSGTKQVVFGDILKRATRFPPLIGCILALTVPRFINLAPLDPLFTAIAATTAPLAFFQWECG